MADKFTFKRLLSLYKCYARMDLNWFLRDTRLALLAIAADTIMNVALISGVLLLALKFNGLGGMNQNEVLLMLGYVTLVTGLFQLFFANGNTGHISRRIGRGQFDHMMLQPLPYPVQLITEGFIPFTGSQNAWLGLLMSIYAVGKLNLNPSFLWWAWFIGSLLVSLSLVIGLSYLFSSLAFFRPVAFEEIATTVIDETTGVLSNYPLGAMPQLVQLALITVLPAGLLGWFPVCSLLNQAPFGLSRFYPIFLSLIVWLMALNLFRKGLRHYVLTGSNRYKATGFRR